MRREDLDENEQKQALDALAVIIAGKSNLIGLKLSPKAVEYVLWIVEAVLLRTGFPSAKSMEKN